MNFNWPRNAGLMLSQSVLHGKAQKAYVTLSMKDSEDNDLIRSVILKSYELVPEAYRQKFRNHKKIEAQTYVDFLKQKEAYSTNGIW